MIALYPSYPSRPKEPDPAFGWEVQWAKAAGFKIAFVDLELQLGGEVILRRLPEEQDVVYRGWLIKPEDYLRLEEALNAKGYRLLETFEAYREAYEFPRWYAKLKDETPRSLVIDGSRFDLDAVADKVQLAFSTRLSERDQRRAREIGEWCSKNFCFGAYPIDLLELPGPRPVILKDFVKSRKQDWFDACFIPDVRDKENVKRVIKRFLELTEGTLAGGLVFRQFENFKKIGTHPKTKMPVVNEWRGFMLHGKLIYLAPYWASGDYSTSCAPNSNLFEDIASKNGLASPFFSLDIAEKGDGTWSTIEINSGGASGVPEGGNVEEFYKSLASGTH